MLNMCEIIYDLDELVYLKGCFSKGNQPHTRLDFEVCFFPEQGLKVPAKLKVRQSDRDTL